MLRDGEVNRFRVVGDDFVADLTPCMQNLVEVEAGDADERLFLKRGGEAPAEQLVVDQFTDERSGDLGHPRGEHSLLDGAGDFTRQLGRYVRFDFEGEDDLLPIPSADFIPCADRNPHLPGIR